MNLPKQTIHKGIKNFRKELCPALVMKPIAHPTPSPDSAISLSCPQHWPLPGSRLFKQGHKPGSTPSWFSGIDASQ